MLNSALYNLMARVIFVVTSFGIHLYLARIASVSEYGRIGLILSILTIIYVFFTNGLRQAASRYIAEFPNSIGAIIREGFRYQLLFSTVVAIGYYFSANLIAVFLKDLTLESELQLSAIIIVPTATYFLVQGILNGKKAFKKEAATLAVYSICKIGFVIFFHQIGISSARSVIFGYFLAAIIAILFSGVTVAKEFDCSLKLPKEINLLKFAWPVIIFFGGVTFLQNIDLILFKRFIQNETLVGYFSAYVTIARMPYFLLYAFSSVSLPIVAQLYSTKQIEKMTQSVSKMLKYLFVFSIPVLSMGIPLSSKVISFIYPSEYSSYSNVLSLLLIATFLSVFWVTMSTILVSIGKIKKIVPSVVVVIVMSIILNSMLLLKGGIDAAGYGTIVAYGMGLCVSTYFVIKEMSISWSTLDLQRILVANVLISILSILFGHYDISIVIVGSVLSVIYLLLLIIFKVVSIKEFFSLVNKRK